MAETAATAGSDRERLHHTTWMDVIGVEWDNDRELEGQSVDIHHSSEPTRSDIRRRLSLAEFRSAGLEAVEPVAATESIPITEAVGRVAAEPLAALWPLPGFRRSAVDGYALRAADAHRPLTVVDKVTAGHSSERRVGPGEAVMVTTGAMVPEGADAVALVERSVREGDVVRIEEEIAPGSHVSPVGEDFRVGQPLIAAGRVLEPIDIAALASQGLTHVVVWRKPRVAILSTGDELVPLGDALVGAQVYDVNGAVLAAMVRAAGAEPVPLGRLVDRYPVVRDGLLATAHRDDWDLLVTSGGTGASVPVFMGQPVEEMHDLMPAVLDEVGELTAHGIRMTPGRPTALGRLGGRPAFLLPGWPYAVLVHFELVVAPALAKMGHRPLPARRPVRARVAEPLAPNPELTRVLQAELAADEAGGWRATLLMQPPPPSASRIMTQMLRADGFVIVDRGQRLEPGEEVTVWVLGASKIQDDMIP